MRTRPLLLVVACSVGAIAHTVGATVPLRQQVEALLDDPALDSTSSEVANAKAQAKASLTAADATRSTRAEDAEAVAKEQEETALEWAQLSKELTELAALRAQAETAEQRQLDLEAQLKREKAHLEETEARRGRALAALEKLGESADVATPGVSPKPAGGAP